MVPGTVFEEEAMQETIGSWRYLAIESIDLDIGTNFRALPKPATGMATLAPVIPDGGEKTDVADSENFSLLLDTDTDLLSVKV